MGEIAILGIIAPQLFIANCISYSAVFTMGLSILCVTIKRVCVCVRMSPPAVVPQVMLNTQVNSASCSL